MIRLAFGNGSEFVRSFNFQKPQGGYILKKLLLVAGLFLFLFPSVSLAERNSGEDVRRSLHGEDSSVKARRAFKILKKPFRVVKEGDNFIIITTLQDDEKWIFSWPVLKKAVAKKKSSLPVGMQTAIFTVRSPRTAKELDRALNERIHTMPGNLSLDDLDKKRRILLPKGVGKRKNSRIQTLVKNRISNKDLQSFQGGEVRAIHYYGP